MNNILLVFIGGGTGSVLRYLLSLWINRIYKSGFPWATLSVNVAACFILGLLSGYLLTSKPGFETQRLLIGVGLCGGFSTFSTFTFEVFEQFRLGNYISSLLYITASISLCLVAFWAAWMINKPA